MAEAFVDMVETCAILQQTLSGSQGVCVDTYKDLSHVIRLWTESYVCRYSFYKDLYTS